MEKEEKIVVGIGDIKIGKAPTIITTYLGSCIAVCFYASSDKVGGLLHIMLGSAHHAQKKNNVEGFNKAKYADTGIPELLRQLKQSYIIKKEDVVAKIFGGANVLKSVKHKIGDTNETIVRQTLQDLDIKIVASQTGGEKGYRVEFDLGTGKVFCKVFGEETREY